jgi:hypothetical protein
MAEIFWFYNINILLKWRRKEFFIAIWWVLRYIFGVASMIGVSSVRRQNKGIIFFIRGLSFLIFLSV